MLDLQGKIVEFLNDGQLTFGLVTADSAGKVQLTDANGRNRSVHSRNILVVHPVAAGLLDFGPILQPLRSEIEALAEEVDTELLWEVIRSHSGALDPGFLAREYFGEEESKTRSAVLRAAMADPIHFRQKGAELYVRPPAQVEQQIHQRQVEREKEERRQAVSDWLNAALADSEMEETEGEFANLLDATQKFLLSRNVAPPDFLTESDPEIWKRTPILREFTTREAAFHLMVCSGRLPEDAEPLLVIAGVKPSFSAEAETAATRLTAYREDPARLSLEHLEALAVDDDGTVEVDDAITLESTASGWSLGIHIADTAHFVDPEGPLFEEAAARVSTLYLPHRLLTMLPARLSCELASLQRDQLRPVVSTLVEVDETGEIRDYRICRAHIRVAQRLSYDQVDQVLAGGDDTTLNWLSWFAGLLRQKRSEAGALNMTTPEFKVRVDDRGRVAISRLDPGSPARTLIAELMILTNSLAAAFAQENEIQLVYRSQKPPKKEVKVPDEYDPIAMRDVFRSLERSLYGLTPEPHSGLGLKAYTQTTSPLRRLVDLISQTQISAFLQGSPAVFSEEQLLERLRGVGETERNLRAVERRAVSYHVLKYLWEHKRQEKLRSIVLGPADRGSEVELMDYPVRARLLGGKVRPKPGDKIEVEIDQVDPDKISLVVRNA